MSETLTQGQRIRQMRLECRFTQEYVAAQLNTTKQAIYKYEADLIKNIPIDKLLRLAQLFQCSPAWLQTLSDDRGTPPSNTTAPLLDIPCGVPHYGKQDANLSTADPITFYRDLMDLMVHLTPAERETIMKFAAFLVAQHNAPTQE